MIKLENVTLPYALKQISCQIPQGKIFGIMGANGAGKSTLLKAIAGIIPVTSGQIWLENYQLSELNAQQKSTKLAYLAQNTAIHWDLLVKEVIELGLPMITANCAKQVQQIAKIFSVDHLLNQPFQQLSGGEKARVQLARCCIKNSPILLVDEPIAALDPYYQIDILEQLRALTPEKTCVIAIHHLDLAYRFCDEIILLGQGEIKASGKTVDVLNTDNLASVFKVKAEIDRQKGLISQIRKL